MESLVLQYVIIFAALLAASYSIYKSFKNFSPKNSIVKERIATKIAFLQRLGCAV